MKEKQTQQLMDIGKLPPQAIELEEAVLGSMMLEHECIPSIVDILKTESFYNDINSVVFNAIYLLHKQSYPVDILTVTQQLKKTGELDFVGGAYYITQLTNRVASGANAEFHARIISQKYIQRELIKIGSQTINNAYKDSADIFNLIEELEKNVTLLTGNFRGNKYNTMPKLWNALIEKNETLLKAKGVNGIPSGYKDIDRVTGGWQKGNSIIIAARPAMGKTAFAINCACNASVRFGKPGVIFSLEMSALELFTRMASSESDTSNNKFNRKGIPEEEMVQVGNNCSKLINAPLYIDDTAGLTLIELRSKAREHKRKNNIEFIIIDYLQLMENNNSKGNREQDISAISRGIKTLAKELEIPIISLSQLSRGTEQRGGQKKPVLSDLRESGAIEQDADVVMFIHRPEYYGIKEFDDGRSTHGMAEMMYAKNRNGPSNCSDYLGFINYLTKFVDSDYMPDEKQIQEPKMQSDPNEYIEGQNETVHY